MYARKIRYQIEFDGDPLRDLLKKVERRTKNLEPVFLKAEERLKESWIFNFTTQGSLVGGWKPLDAEYGAWKAKRYIGAPMLVQNGKLFRSLERLNVRVIRKKSATFGIRGDVAKFHQFGTWSMPKREIIFEPPLFAKQLEKDVAEYLEDAD
jgi:hypothetical protein